MIAISIVCLIVALVFAGLSTINYPSGRINLFGGALFFLILGLLVNRF